MIIVRNKTINTLLNGKNKKIWIQALSNELGRLTTGKTVALHMLTSFAIIGHLKSRTLPHTFGGRRR